MIRQTFKVRLIILGHHVLKVKLEAIVGINSDLTNTLTKRNN